MTITNEPIVPGSPVKFKVTGFPDEGAIRSSVERFYALKPDAYKSFYVYNAFDEEIFTGSASEAGKVENLNNTYRPGKGPIIGDNKPR